MIFSQNADKKPQFPKAFNDIARKPFDEKAFLKAAEDAGYLEARIQKPGESIIIQREVGEKRVTAQLNEQGFLKRYLFG